jgi:hypothetical protein
MHITEHSSQLGSYPELSKLLKSEPTKVTIYRGTGAEKRSIREGDFVTLDESYARHFGEVVSHEVSTKDLIYFQHCQGIPEFVYNPKKKAKDKKRR